MSVAAKGLACAGPIMRAVSFVAETRLRLKN